MNVEHVVCKQTTHKQCGQTYRDGLSGAIIGRSLSAASTAALLLLLLAASLCARRCRLLLLQLRQLLLHEGSFQGFSLARLCSCTLLSRRRRALPLLRLLINHLR